MGFRNLIILLVICYVSYAVVHENGVPQQPGDSWPMHFHIHAHSCPVMQLICCVRTCSDLNIHTHTSVESAQTPRQMNPNSINHPTSQQFAQTESCK
jgi:hypothetical protein